MLDIQTDAEFIIGSDEVGFGAWAGPIFVCAVIAPKDWKGIPGLKDSKKMSEKQLDAVYKAGKALPEIRSVMKIVPSEEIDRKGARKSLISAHQQAISELLQSTDKKCLVISDGNMNIEGAVSIPKADDKVPAVSLASVFAKVERDRLMVEFGEQYPAYGFEDHVGYGTKNHQIALMYFGPCAIHRMSYAPVKKFAAFKEERKNSWEDLLDD